MAGDAGWGALAGGGAAGPGARLPRPEGRGELGSAGGPLAGPPRALDASIRPACAVSGAEPRAWRSREIVGERGEGAGAGDGLRGAGAALEGRAARLTAV